MAKQLTPARHKKKFERSPQQTKRYKLIVTISIIALVPVFIWLIVSTLSFVVAAANKRVYTAANFVDHLLDPQILIISLGAGGIFAMTLIFMVLLRQYQPKIKTKNQVFGSAAWSTFHEIQKHYPAKTLQTPHAAGWVFHSRTPKTKQQNKYQKNMKFNAAGSKHGLVIGSTGSGKTQNIILPSIVYNLSAQDHPSLVVTDPKGAIEKAVNPFIAKYNYQKYVFDFIDFNANKWNPLYEIQALWNRNEFDAAELKIDSLVNTLISEIKNHRDPIWHLASGNLITAVIICSLLEKAQDHNNLLVFDNIIDQLSKTVDSLREWISVWYADNKQLRRCSNIIFENAEPKFLETVKKNAEIALKALRNGKFAAMSKHNDLNFMELNTGGKIIFLKTHVTDETFWFLSQIFINQLINHIIHSHRLHSSTPILFCLDEFGNIPKIPSFKNVLSTAREYNMWFIVVIQSYNQLDQYEFAKDIIANCDLRYYLHTNNVDTAKRIEQEYGNQTVQVRNYNSAGQATNSHNIGRPLIDYYDLMHLEPNNMIVKLGLQNPWKTVITPFYKYCEVVL